MTKYHYTECGLNNVILHNLPMPTDDVGDRVITIPAVNLLHGVLAGEIILSEGSISGEELRFLRTHLGMTQDELASFLHVERLTIGRWERGENPIDSAAEVLVRLKLAENLPVKMPPIEELSRKCFQMANKPPIQIDGSDPKKYRPLAA